MQKKQRKEKRNEVHYYQVQVFRVDFSPC